MRYFLSIILILCMATACGGGGNGKSDGGKTTSESENPPFPVIDTVTGFYEADTSSKYQGCEYGVCGSDFSSSDQTLILDKNKKFLYCESGSSSGSTSIPGINGLSLYIPYDPIGSGGSSVYSSSYINCVYGTFAVLSTEDETIKISFKPERIYDSIDQPACLEPSDKEFEASLKDIKDTSIFQTEQEMFVYYDESGHVQKNLGDLKWVSDAVYNIFIVYNHKYYLPMGIDFDNSYAAVTIYKECRSWEEQQLAHVYYVTSDNGSYIPVDKSGYYGAIVSAAKGQIFELTLFSSSGYGYLSITPKDGVMINDIDYIDYLASCPYDANISDLYQPSSVNLPKITTEADDSQINFDHSVLDLSYIVPADGEYEIHYTNCDALDDEDYDAEGKKGDISFMLLVFE